MTAAALFLSNIDSLWDTASTEGCRLNHWWAMPSDVHNAGAGGWQVLGV